MPLDLTDPDATFVAIEAAKTEADAQAWDAVRDAQAVYREAAEAYQQTYNRAMGNPFEPGLGDIEQAAFNALAAARDAYRTAVGAAITARVDALRIALGG